MPARSALNFPPRARIQGKSEIQPISPCISGFWLHRAPIPEEEPLEPLPGEEPTPDEEEPPPHPDPSLAAGCELAAAAPRDGMSNRLAHSRHFHERAWHGKRAKPL